VFVGTEADFRQAVTLRPGAVTVDAGRGTVLPGFVDAHTHLPFAGWREQEFDERLRGATYSEIAARGGGILSTVASTRGMDREHLAAQVRARLDAMLALGTTTVEAKSGYGLSLDGELKQLQALGSAAEGHPVEVVRTFLGAHTVPAEYRDRRQAYLDAQAFSIDEARRVLGAAREQGLGVRLHADQLGDDGAAMLAAELGAASADHLEYAADAGIEALARSGTCGVLLPAATFFLMMDARPPGRKLIEAGVGVVVATDFNPGSCPSESMGTALTFACLSARLTVDEAITAATLNAAHALGRAQGIGSLEPGKRADLVIHAVPNRYHLVYRFGVPRVDKVIVDGKLVFDRQRAATAG
jgi:imidazolonepropionase